MMSDVPVPPIEAIGWPSTMRLVALAIAVFLLAFAYGSIRIDRPFIGDKEGTACGLVMMPPLNYLRYGPFEQRLGGIINPGLVDRANFTSYVHHPPGVTIASALAHAMFGRADWAARLAPTLFMALTATLVFVAIATGGSGIRAGLFAAATLCLVPFTAFYGGMPDYVNFQVAFFTALTVWLWLRTVASTTRSARLAVVVAFTLACMSDWPGFYAAPVIWLGAWAIRRRFDLFDHVLFPLIAAGLLAGLAGWMMWAGADTSLMERVLYRSAGEPDQSGKALGVAQWFAGVLRMIALLHTWPVLLAATLYAIVATAAAIGSRFAKRVTPPSPARTFTLGLGGVLLVHFVVARQGCYQHEWWHVMFTPAVAAGAGLASHALLRPLERYRGGRWIGGAMAAVAFATLAVWSARLDRERRDFYTDAGSYTLKELGVAIRAAAAPDEGVLTSDSSDWINFYVQSALGWYADRQLRPCIIDVGRLNASLDAGPYRVFYGYMQPGGPRPRWFVMPQPDRDRWPDLARHLDEHYARRTDGKFDVYDLARPH